MKSSDVTIMKRLIDASQNGATAVVDLTSTTKCLVEPYRQPATGSLLLVAPQLGDSALVGLLQEPVLGLSETARPTTTPTTALLHAARCDGHDAIILSLAAAPSLAECRELGQRWQMDVGVCRRPAPWAWPKGVVFDMDSTLITMEVIDELAREAGAGDAVAAITEAAMRGELDFNASLIKRVANLRGLSALALTEVRNRLQFNDGVREFSARAKKAAVRLAVVSGGFVPFAEWVLQQLHFDYARANTLEFDQDGHLTGTVCGEIVNGAVKARTLIELSAEWGGSTRDVIAVGDGANDCAMLQASAMGVAFRAKPALRQVADLALDFSDMRGLSALFAGRQSAADRTGY